MEDIVTFIHQFEFGGHISHQLPREDLPSVMRDAIPDVQRGAWLFLDARLVAPLRPGEMNEDDTLSWLTKICDQASRIDVLVPLTGYGVYDPVVGEVIDHQLLLSDMIDEFGEKDRRVKGFKILLGKLDECHCTLHNSGVVVKSRPYVITAEISGLVELLKQEVTSMDLPLAATKIQRNEEAPYSECLQITPVRNMSFAYPLAMFVEGLYKRFNNGVLTEIRVPFYLEEKMYRT